MRREYRRTQLCDPEPHLAAGVLPFDGDILHARTRRTAATPGKHGLDLLLRAFERALDRPVPQVGDEAAEPERACPVAGLIAEADALDGAANPDVCALIARRSPPPPGAGRSGTERSAGPPALQGCVPRAAAPARAGPRRGWPFARRARVARTAAP